MSPKAAQVAGRVFKRFGRLVVPVQPPVAVGDSTNKYGNVVTGMRFRYTKPATMIEWKEHARFLRSIGVGVPKAAKPEGCQMSEQICEDCKKPTTCYIPLRNGGVRCMECVFPKRKETKFEPKLADRKPN